MRDHMYTTALCVLAVALILGAWMAHRGQSHLAVALTEQSALVRQTMASLAVLIDRNGADETIAGIVTDCVRREEFEALLIKLSVLSKQELLSAQTLFESCGDFYPTQKALMVMRLKREYAAYTELHNLKERLVAVGDTAQDDRVHWEELITLEETRSELLIEQTALQGTIIHELVRGFRATSSEVRTLVAEAQEIAELLSVYDTRIDELRGLLQIS
jgi:hypothetical protein